MNTKFHPMNLSYRAKQMLTLLLLNFIIIGNAFSQNPEICLQIGDVGNKESFDLPFAGVVTHSYLQQIFTAEELAAQEIENGDKLTGISFNYFWETPTKRPIKIFLGNTHQDNFTNSFTSHTELTEVYASGCHEFSKGDKNWTKISFDPPFEYTGGNIIVATLMNIEDATDPTNCFTENSTPGIKRFYVNEKFGNLTRFAKLGGDTPITFDATSGMPMKGEIEIEGNFLNFRNNIKFCKIGPPCPKVTGITAPVIEDTSITLNWTAGNTEESWTIEYGISGFTQGEGIIVESNTTTKEIPNLTATTSYDFYIRANCSEENSEWTGKKTYTTSCGVFVGTDYVEEFNSNSTSLDCWTIIDANQDATEYSNNGKWVFQYGLAKYTFNSSNAANDWLISPKMRIEDGMLLDFYYKATNSGYPEKFSVWVITGESPENYVNATNLVSTKTVTNSSLTKIDPINLSNFKDQEVYIGIKCESDASMNALFIDNFRVYVPSKENDIKSFELTEQISDAIINYDTHRVDIEVAFSADLTNLKPTITISNYANITPASGEIRDFSNEVSYLVTAEDGTPQEWKVKVKNAESPLSDNDIISFTFYGQEGASEIDQENHTIKAIIHFENPLTNIKPKIEISHYATIEPGSETEQDFTTPVTYNVKAEDNSSIQAWVVTIEKSESPMGATCENPVILNLSALNSPHIIAGETTQGFGNVYHETDMGDYDNNSDKLYKLSVSEKSVYNIKVNPLQGYAGVGIFRGCPSENILLKKAVNYYYNGTDEIVIKDFPLKPEVDYFLMVDKSQNPKFLSYDLSFEKNESVTCLSPLDLAISEITTNSAKFTWSQAFNENNWELIYGPSYFNLLTGGTLVSEDINSSPKVLEVFSEETSYDIYIRSKCSETEHGEWVGPLRFKTLEACPTPTNVEINEINTNSAVISWESNGAENWIIEYKLSAEEEFGSVETNTNPHTLSDLAHSSKYEFRIKAKCEGVSPDESHYTFSKSFYTKCDNITTHSYSEDFENYGVYSSDAFPTCWYRPLVHNYGTTTYPSINYTTDMDGYCLKFYSPPTIPTIACTPKFSENVENLVLEFQLKRDNDDSGSMTIGLMDNSEDPSTFTAIKTITPENNYAQKYTIKFYEYPSLTGTNKHIAFKHSSNGVNATYWLDNVTTHKLRTDNDILSFTCPGLLNDVQPNYEDHTITGLIAFSADITKQIPTITISDYATIEPASGIIQNFSNDVTYTVISESGQSQIWTVKLTKSTVASSEKKILSFKFPDQVGESVFEPGTTNITAKLDWLKPLHNIKPSIQISNMASISPASGLIQNFAKEEGVTYIVTAEDGSTENWNVKITHTESPPGANCENPVVLNLSTLNSPHIITGETTEGFGDIYNETSLDYYDGGPDKLYKLNVTEGAIYTILMNTSTIYSGMGLFKGCPSENKIIDMAISQSAGEKIIEDVLLQANTDYFLMVDNYPPNPDFIKSYDLTFTKNENPPCTSPTDLEITDILQTTATVSWSQALSETEWDLIYGEIGFNPDGFDIAPISISTTPTYNLTGLTKEKDYSIYIRSKCTEATLSNWKGPIPFKTLKSCPEPTDLVISSISANSAIISWNGHTVDKWKIEYKTSSDTDYQSQEATTNPFTLTGLTSGSSYEVKIMGLCDGPEESLYSEEKTFNTLCDFVATTSLIEEFSDDSSTKNCWTIIDVQDDGDQYGYGKWLITESMAKYKYNSNAANDWLISPQISITEGMVLSLKYKVANVSYPEKFSVWIIQGDNPYEYQTNSLNIIPTKEVSNQDFMTLPNISLANFIGEKIYVGIKCESDEERSTLSIDDFRVYIPSNKNDIISFVLPTETGDATINIEEHTVDIEVAFSTNLTSLAPTITVSEFASIEPDSGVERDFSNEVIYKVTSETGIAQDWKVNVKKATNASSENEILSFKFPLQVGESIINNAGKTVTAVAKWNADLTAISPTIDISPLASISPESGAVKDFTNPVTYVVKAEDNTEKPWTVTITNDPNNPCESVFAIPFIETFSQSSTSVDCWTIIDNNNDGNEATGSGLWSIISEIDTGKAHYQWHYTNNADDWLISPKIKISTNASISFDYKSSGFYPEKFSVYIIEGEVIDINNAEQILPTVNVSNLDYISISPISLSNHIGKELHIAIKCESEKNHNKLEITNFKVDNLGGTDNTEFSLTASVDGGNGTITPTNSNVNAGGEETFTITANTGYELESLIDNDAPKTVDANGQYKLTNINEDHTIVVKFKQSGTPSPSSYTLKASVEGGNGTINPSEETAVTAGSNFEFTVTANEGYELEYLKDNGQTKTSSVTSDGKYKLTGINSDHTIVVKFKEYVAPTIYKLTTEVVGGNGNISPSSVEVVANGSYTFTITPNNGYVLDELIDNNDPKITAVVDNKYTLTGIDKDHHIVLKFKEEVKAYKLSTSVFGGNGSISPISETVNAGSDFEFTITPAQGYILDNLKDNNTDKTDNVSEGKYKLTNIQEDHTIVVKFKLGNSITEESILDIKIYPNPTNDLLNIEVSDEISDIEILTINGKLIHKQRVNDNKFQYQTNVLAEGNYLIKIYTNNKIITKQFSVKR